MAWTPLKFIGEHSIAQGLDLEWRLRLLVNWHVRPARDVGVEQASVKRDRANQDNKSLGHEFEDEASEF